MRQRETACLQPLNWEGEEDTELDVTLLFKIN